MDLLGNNGVLVWLAIAGTNNDASIPIDSITRGHVLGNKATIGSVNSAHEDFTNGVDRLHRFEELWPGLTLRLITERLRPDEASRIAEAVGGGVKTVVEFA
jgi:hypothetical protein